MPSRFGLKDFVFLLLLCAVGASVWLKMVQDDRQWRKLSGIETRLGEIEKRLGELRTPAIPSNGKPAPVDPAPHAPIASQLVDAPLSTVAQPQPRTGPDESWARPGVPVAQQPPVRFQTDPRQVKGFQEGGELTELLEADPGCITPYIAISGASARVLELVVESLADIDPATLQLRGLLAEAWQIDPAGLWVRARLREGAVFSDGTPVTAADIAWAFEHIVASPEVRAARFTPLRDIITSCAALDPRTIEFTFKERYYLNIESALTLPVIPRAFYEQFQPSQLNQSTGIVMGSGPFRLQVNEPGDQWKKNTSVKLVRNERYWGPRPALERIVFRAAPDPKARVEAYLAGEADIVTPSAADFAATQQEPGFADRSRAVTWTGMRGGWVAIGWQCGQRKSGKATPFVDVRVRRAMTMLLDRQWMLKSIYGAQGEVAHGPFNPRSPMSNRSLQPVRFDVEAARALLAEAGWRDRDADGVIENESGQRFEFEFVRLSTEDSDRRLAAYLVDQCRAAGIACNDVQLEATALSARMREREFDAMRMSSGHTAVEPDPQSRWHSAGMAAGGGNYCNWSSPECDRLIDAGRGELDQAKRAAIWQQVEGAIADGQPCTFLRHAPAVRLIRREIGNVNVYATGLLPAEFFRAPTAPVAPPQ